MIIDNIVVGGVLVVMAGAQTWLRFGPWAKEQEAAEKEVAARRAAVARAAREGADDQAESGEAGESSTQASLPTDRGSKLWNKWTAVLGPLGIALGMALVIWGAVGS